MQNDYVTFGNYNYNLHCVYAMGDVAYKTVVCHINIRNEQVPLESGYHTGGRT